MDECAEPGERGVGQQMAGGRLGARRRSGPRAVGMTVGLLVSLVLASAAHAASPAYDLQGTWTTGYLGSDGSRAPANGTMSITQMDMSTGAFSGTSVITGVNFVLSGTESGNSVTFTQTEGSYVAHDVIPALSILPDDNIGGNGTFEAGGFWMEVTSPLNLPNPNPTVSSVASAPGGATTTVSCPAGAQSCPITVNLSVVEVGQVVTAQKAKRRTVTIGSTAVTLSAGQKRTIIVSLNRAGRKLL